MHPSSLQKEGLLLSHELFVIVLESQRKNKIHPVRKGIQPQKPGQIRHWSFGTGFCLIGPVKLSNPSQYGRQTLSDDAYIYVRVHIHIHTYTYTCAVRAHYTYISTHIHLYTNTHTKVGVSMHECIRLDVCTFSNFSVSHFLEKEKVQQ